MNTIYGQNAILSLLQKSPKRVKQLFFKDTVPSGFARYAKVIPHQIMKVREFELMLPGKVHQGVAAQIEEKSAMPIEKLYECKAVAVLDDITDIHNIGAIIRSAYAFGIEAIIVNKKMQILKKADVYKTSVGYIESIGISEVTNIADTLRMLKKKGFWIFGMHLDGGKPIQIIQGFNKKAIVLGSEGGGIRPLNRKLCDEFVSIPMQNDCESLNVSVAAAIAFYAMSNIGKTE